MKTVLIIEDDLNLREGLELLLQIEGYQTLGTSNGVDGIEMIRRHQPDVVLTNFQMPGADGLDVLRAVREDPELTEMPIIFLTADHSPSVRHRAVHAGADTFFTKPFDTEELIRAIARLGARADHEYSS